MLDVLLRTILYVSVPHELGAIEVTEWTLLTKESNCIRIFFCGCRGITRIHRLPSRPSHSYGRQPHSLIFMSTLYKAMSCLPVGELTSDHEPACLCHLYRPRIKTHVSLHTMPCFIDSFIARQWRLSSV